MQTLKFDTREEWLNARRGKITGSRLKDIIVKRGTGKKIGFYELIAERLGIAGDDENAMDRGTRLEPEAMAKYVEVTGQDVDTSLVIWTREDNESIAISPDGFIGETKAVEVKCLSSARHIEAYLTHQIPDEYEYQKLQYFIVNDKLETLDFAFYDPRLLAQPFFIITIKREDVQEQVIEYLEYQRKTIEEVNAVVNSLTF
jgi:predicted phage-related endonuclease